jgi:hypothetical protein
MNEFYILSKNKSVPIEKRKKELFSQTLLSCRRTLVEKKKIQKKTENCIFGIEIDVNRI